MQRKDAMRFAEAWVEAWNRRDIERVLALYADKFSFTSPTALQVIGRATVVDKGVLRDYWQRALAKMDDLRFSLDRILWDEETRELGIVYTSQLSGNTKRVLETFLFNEDDDVIRTEVLHGNVP